MKQGFQHCDWYCYIKRFNLKRLYQKILVRGTNFGQNDLNRGYTFSLMLQMMTSLYQETLYFEDLKRNIVFQNDLSQLSSTTERLIRFTALFSESD